MTLTFQLDLVSISVNQHAKYLGERSSNSKVIFWNLNTYTHQTEYSTWTTKMIGNYLTSPALQRTTSKK